MEMVVGKGYDMCILSKFVSCTNSRKNCNLVFVFSEPQLHNSIPYAIYDNLKQYIIIVMIFYTYVCDLTLFSQLIHVFF